MFFIPPYLHNDSICNFRPRYPRTDVVIILVHSPILALIEAITALYKAILNDARGKDKDVRKGEVNKLQAEIWWKTLTATSPMPVQKPRYGS